MLRSMPTPSIEIPDHVVIEKIGSGGMSSVFLGKQISLQRKVAIKVLRQSLVEDSTLAERFVDEAKTIALLDHPNIISIYEAKRLPSGMSYFTMPYLNHGHFGDIICTNAKHLIDLLCQICDGLACAHEHGVVHRDLKPDNILFDRFGHLKIADFGIAISRNKKRQTNDQQILGSAHYMSPEQIQSKAVNHLSDIYSLGCIIYEKLTGDNVFNAENDFAILLAHINKPIPELPKTLASWQPILNKCLAKNPAERYQSALEVKQDLLTIRDQENETSRGIFAVKLPQWLQTGHFLIVCGLLLITALFAYLIFGNDAPDSPSNKMLPPTTVKPIAEQRTTASKPVAKPKPKTTATSPSQKTVTQTPEAKPQTGLQQQVSQPTVQQSLPETTKAEPIDQQPQDLNVEIIAITPLDAENRPLTAEFDSEVMDAELDNIEPTEMDLEITQPELNTLTKQAATSVAEPSLSSQPLDTIQTTEQTAILLQQGQQLLKTYRLTKPKGENALAKFRQVLAIDPKNTEAKQGIEKIAYSYLTLIKSKWKKNQGKSAIAYAKTLVNFIDQHKINRNLFTKSFNNLEQEVTSKLKQAIKIRRRFKHLNWQVQTVNILQGKPKRLAELQQNYTNIPRSGKVISDASGINFVFFAVNSNTAGLGDFMISQNEITVSEYQQFAGGQKVIEKCSHFDSKPIFKRFTWQKAPFKQNGKHPVVCVSAKNASAYAKWLSAKTGHHYRLPTKQEWLYLNQISNHKDNCKSANLAGTEIKNNRKFKAKTLNCKDGHEYTAEVGSFPANKYRLNDLNGNVAEWVSLCKAPKKCSQFGIAGHSWKSGTNLNNKSISALNAAETQSDIGFRLVKELYSQAN